jgi:hypothetical protein
MAGKNYAYLGGAQTGRTQDPAQLPTSLLTMQLDPYRGLAWAVMVAGGYAERKDVFFQEFAWGNYFRDKVRWDDRDDAAFTRAVEEAGALAHAPAATALPGYSPNKVVPGQK